MRRLFDWSCRQPRWVLWAFSAALAIGSLLLAKALHGPLGHLYFSLPIAALLVIGFCAGRLAAFVAVLAVGVSSLFLFTEPPHSFTLASPDDRLNLMLFAVLAGLVGWAGGSLRALFATLARLARESDHRAAEVYALFQSMADGVIVYGPGGEIRHINPVAERWLGYDKPERRRLPMKDRLALFRFHAEDGQLIPPERGPLGRAFRGETVRNSVLRVEGADGFRFEPEWVSFSTAPIIARSGERIGVVATFTDVSHLHEVREEREDLLRAISHDLRTPLNAIGMQAHMVRRHCNLPETVTCRVEGIANNAKRIRAVLDDVLGLMQVGMAGLPDAETVRLKAFATDMACRVFGEAEASRIDLDISDALAAQMSPHHLERILTNLLSNAFKYSPAGSLVRVAAREEADAVRLSVSDRGQGIPPEELPHVFDRYFRAKGARKAKGSGLGLYITRALVEGHGGTVDVASTPGEGSTFSVTLPLSSCESLTTAPV